MAIPIIHTTLVVQPYIPHILYIAPHIHNRRSVETMPQTNVMAHLMGGYRTFEGVTKPKPR